MKKRTLRFLILTSMVALLGLIVMFLWNAILPSVTGWASLNYPQGVGLFVLCRILFGGFSGIKQRARMSFGGENAKIKEQLKGMSKEEKREHIRNHMQSEQGQCR